MRIRNPALSIEYIFKNYRAVQIITDRKAQTLTDPESWTLISKMFGSGCGKMMQIPPDPDQQHRKTIKLSFIKRSNADEE
jgi:hypothetical protein